MMKHPIALAFVVAAVVSLALAAIVMAMYSAQQAPWALAMVVLAFPFIWFFAWISFNAINWWREMTTDEAERERAPPP